MKAKKFDLIKCSEMHITNYDDEFFDNQRYFNAVFQGKDSPSVKIKKIIYEHSHPVFFNQLKRQIEHGDERPTLKVLGTVMTIKHLCFAGEKNAKGQIMQIKATLNEQQTIK